MVKKSLLFCLVFALSISMFAQVPDAFKYQAVIRNSSGEILLDQNISIRISILDGSATGTNVFSETHSETTSDLGLIAINIGKGDLVSGDFSTINWSTGDKYLKIEIDENGGSTYTELGTVQLLAVPYALHANSAEKLGDENIYSPVSDTLFVVKDHDGNVVFAVFPDGAQVYVNEAAKGKVGGFAISGRSPNKAFETDILRVTADSTRFYVDEGPVSKGKVGGFAISGRSPNKDIINDYLFVTADSTRIYVNDTATLKGKVGGFAISGRSPNKGTLNDYLKVTRDSTRVYINESSEKGKVGGFAISGRSPNKGIETDYFNVSGNTNAEIINPVAFAPLPI
ncbi:hypothetical protein ACFLSE_05505, partial [Bacteroidota bacterium]